MDELTTECGLIKSHEVQHEPCANYARHFLVSQASWSCSATTTCIGKADWESCIVVLWVSVCWCFTMNMFIVWLHSHCNNEKLSAQSALWIFLSTTEWRFLLMSALWFTWGYMYVFFWLLGSTCISLDFCL